MAKKYDYPKLSNFVGSIVDRRIRTIALSITSSVGYLKSLVTQSSNYATNSHDSANVSQAAATDASGSAAAVTIIYNNFTSTYVGVKSSDPQKSSLNNKLTANSFYIRSTDSHLRYVAAIDNNTGIVTWQDAVVGADPQSVITVCNGRYLSLVQPLTIQDVQGPVNFNKITTVPSVTDWNSHQATPASDVRDLVNTTSQPLVREIARAKQAEIALNDRVNQTYIDIEAYADNAAVAAGNVVQTNLNGFASYFLSGSNVNGYWEKRYGGVVEQWGRVRLVATNTSVMGTTINFPIRFGDAASVSVNTTPLRTTSSTWTESASMIQGDPTQDYCALVIGTSNPTQTFTNDIIVAWRAIGFAATPEGGDPVPVSNGTAGANPGSTPNPVNNGTPPSSDPGNTGGGGGGSGGTSEGGPSLCPEHITPILLANEDKTGPGEFITADKLCLDDYVWTQHEKTMSWGAFKVIQARSFETVLWQATGYYRATKRHPMYLNDNWVTIDTFGTVSGNGIAVAITVEDAHTFVSLDLAGNQILNHNLKTGD